MNSFCGRFCVSAGKKGSELGEYDPLTQADSEDESEEDDLVLNYPRNGLNRDSCLASGSTSLRGGRSRRIVGATDDVQEEDEEDEWTERLPKRQDRDHVKASQYWSHRDSGREKMGEDRGSAGGSASGIRGTDDKRGRGKNAVRSAFFLVPLFCATMLVLLCAFLIPCQKRELQKKLQWEKALGDAGGEGVSLITDVCISLSVSKKHKYSLRAHFAGDDGNY